MFGWIAEIAA